MLPNILHRYRHSVRWSPWTIPLSVRCLWLSAQDHGTGLMTDDGAGLISSWIGRGPQTQIFTAPADTTRPTWSATGLGSLYPAVTGDGSNDCMTMASTLGLPTSTAPSVMISLASGAAATSARLFEYGASGANQGRSIRAGGSNQVQVSNGTLALNPALGFRFWTPPAIAVGSWATDLTETGRIDGGGYQLAGTMAALGTLTTRSRLFASTGVSPTGFGAFNLSEHFILSGSIATLLTTIQQIEGWLAWTAYPLLNLATAFPADHPYKGGPP